MKMIFALIIGGIFLISCSKPGGTSQVEAEKISENPGTTRNEAEQIFIENLKKWEVQNGRIDSFISREIPFPFFGNISQVLMDFGKPKDSPSGEKVYSNLDPNHLVGQIMKINFESFTISWLEDSKNPEKSRLMELNLKAYDSRVPGTRFLGKALDILERELGFSLVRFSENIAEFVNSASGSPRLEVHLENNIVRNIRFQFLVMD